MSPAKHLCKRSTKQQMDNPCSLLHFLVEDVATVDPMKFIPFKQNPRKRLQVFRAKHSVLSQVVFSWHSSARRRRNLIKPRKLNTNSHLASSSCRSVKRCQESIVHQTLFTQRSSSQKEPKYLLTLCYKVPFTPPDSPTTSRRFCRM